MSDATVNSGLDAFTSRQARLSAISSRLEDLKVSADGRRLYPAHTKRGQLQRQAAGLRGLQETVRRHGAEQHLLLEKLDGAIHHHAAESQVSLSPTGNIDEHKRVFVDTIRQLGPGWEDGKQERSQTYLHSLEDSLAQLKQETREQAFEAQKERLLQEVIEEKARELLGLKRQQHQAMQARELQMQEHMGNLVLTTNQHRRLQHSGVADMLSTSGRVNDPSLLMLAELDDVYGDADSAHLGGGGPSAESVLHGASSRPWVRKLDFKNKARVLRGMRADDFDSMRRVFAQRSEVETAESAAVLQALRQREQANDDELRWDLQESWERRSRRSQQRDEPIAKVNPTATNTTTTAAADAVAHEQKSIPPVQPLPVQTSSSSSSSSVAPAAASAAVVAHVSAARKAEPVDPYLVKSLPCVLKPAAAAQSNPLAPSSPSSPSASRATAAAVAAISVAPVSVLDDAQDVLTLSVPPTPVRPASPSSSSTLSSSECEALASSSAKAGRQASTVGDLPVFSQSKPTPTRPPSTKKGRHRLSILGGQSALFGGSAASANPPPSTDQATRKPPAQRGGKRRSVFAAQGGVDVYSAMHNRSAASSRRGSTASVFANTMQRNNNNNPAAAATAAAASAQSHAPQPAPDTKKSKAVWNRDFLDSAAVETTMNASMWAQPENTGDASRSNSPVSSEFDF
jgi:hypothetical protein